MSCNLFVSAVKWNHVKQRLISPEGCFFLVFFENNWKSQYSSYHISNIITSCVVFFSDVVPFIFFSLLLEEQEVRTYKYFLFLMFFLISFSTFIKL